MASIPDLRFPWPAAAAATGSPGRLRRLARALLRAVVDYRARRALLALSDHQLKDIGLSRSDLGPGGRLSLRLVDWADLQRRRDGRGI